MCSNAGRTASGSTLHNLQAGKSNEAFEKQIVAALYERRAVGFTCNLGGRRPPLQTEAAFSTAANGLTLALTSRRNAR
jgi:hypothetical protein